MRLWQGLRQSFRLMIGLPDYEAYVRHCRERHPQDPVMSYREFFREAQRRRYGNGRSRCC